MVEVINAIEEKYNGFKTWGSKILPSLEITNAN